MIVGYIVVNALCTKRVLDVMDTLTLAGRCAFCRAVGEHTQEPYGWNHPEPVCEKFKAAVAKPLPYIRQRSDGLGWEVIPTRTCESVLTSREDQSQRECGKPATHSAYSKTIYFCDDCLHDCMEDASPEEIATVVKL